MMRKSIVMERLTGFWAKLAMMVDVTSRLWWMDGRNIRISSFLSRGWLRLHAMARTTLAAP